MLDLKVLGANIAMQRKLQKITQEKLAEKASISTESVKVVEHGNKNYSMKVLQKILKALNIRLVCKIEEVK